MHSTTGRESLRAGVASAKIYFYMRFLHAFTHFNSLEMDLIRICHENCDDMMHHLCARWWCLGRRSPVQRVLSLLEPSSPCEEKRLGVVSSLSLDSPRAFDEDVVMSEDEELHMEETIDLTSSTASFKSIICLKPL